MRSAEELVEIFRANGLKLTPQRHLLFRLLQGNTAHPSADALFAEASALMPGLSLRTVYQTLTDLTEMGELRQLDLTTGAARFDPRTDDHHHLVCDGCGELRDVTVFGSADLTPEGGAQGFALTGTQIVFRGHCPACRAAASPSSPVSGAAVHKAAVPAVSQLSTYHQQGAIHA